MAGFAELQPLLGKALAKEKLQQDADTTAVGVAAQGIARATEFLAREYTLVGTNVPYLAERKQSDVFKVTYKAPYPSKSGPRYGILSTIFKFMLKGGSTIGLVTPQSGSFCPCMQIRELLLRPTDMELCCPPGTRAFETISGDVVNCALVLLIM